MAHKKGQGSSRNGRDSNAQRRGVKRFGGQTVTVRDHARAGCVGWEGTLGSAGGQLVEVPDL